MKRESPTFEALRGSAMVFEYEGGLWQIEFSREKRRVHVADKLTPHVKRVEESKFPYTLATVVEYVEDAFGRATKSGREYGPVAVGCLASENFSYEAGRQKALKAMNNLIPGDMRGRMWESYLYRPRHRRKAEASGGTTTDPTVVEGTIVELGPDDDNLPNVSQ